MRRARKQSDLIYDFGANEGQDTAFYLAKGFRVVAVEANPDLVDMLRATFADALADGRLVLVPHAIAPEAGQQITFYVNDDNSHWSSSHRDWGTRQDTAYREISVVTVTTADVLAEHGCPYYLKVDIEGEDMNVLHALAATKARPPYVSVEEHGVEAIDLLAAMGYRHFKIVNQQQNYLLTNPDPPREGRWVDFAHTGYSSGLFGREVAGEWMGVDEFRRRYLAEFRDADGKEVWTIEHAWWDIHARHKSVRWFRR
jgi:FkbM family methyltransferase